MFKLPIPTRLTDYLGEAMSEPLQSYFMLQSAYNI